MFLIINLLSLKTLKSFIQSLYSKAMCFDIKTMSRISDWREFEMNVSPSQIKKYVKPL
jgi:hypothetical protein